MSPSPGDTRAGHFAFMAGITALVPLPILDQWLERRAHRSLYKVLSEQAGTPFDDATLDLLTEDRSSLLMGCFGMAVFWPIRKLFRTFFYFLTVKDVIDGVAEASLRAAMVRAALPHLPQHARLVRDVMDTTLDRAQFSPASRAFFRGERPPVSWIDDTESVDRTVAWLYQKAGGGPILEAFLQRLATAIPGPSTGHPS